MADAQVPPIIESQAAEEGLLAPEVDGACSEDGVVHTHYGMASAVAGIQRHALRAVGGVGLVMGLVFLVAAVHPGQPAQSRNQEMSKQAMEDAIGLSFFNEMTSVLGSLRDGVKAVDEVITQTNESIENFTTMISEMKGTAEDIGNTSNVLFDAINKPNKWKRAIRKKWKGMNATQRAHFKKKLMRKLNITSWKQLRPKANLSDGNPCLDSEEEHAGLCYSRCSDLTSGKYPYRTSAWTCCAHEPPCTDKTVAEFEVCGGYDTSHAADHCPHATGACLVNEEMYNGYCYKKCALITYGVLPHRGGAASCCNVASKLAFLDLEGCDLDAESYTIGGGKGYSASEPREVHQPIQGLTETTG